MSSAKAVAESIHTPELVPIDSLNLDPANVRKHPRRSLDVLRSSLAEFGQRKAVVVQKTGMIVRAGNGLVMAARELGWTHVLATIVDDDELRALRYSWADNRSAELSEWDHELMRQVVSALPDLSALDGVGFTSDELGSLAKLWKPDDVPGDSTGEPDDFTIKMVLRVPGDLEFDTVRSSVAAWLSDVWPTVRIE